MPGASICRYLRKGRRPRLAMLGYAYADTCKTVCHQTKTGRNCLRWPLAPSIWMAGPDLATGVRAWQWSAYAAATRPHREPESAVAIKQPWVHRYIIAFCLAAGRPESCPLFQVM